MSFEIREGEKKDMPEVLKLIQELARFENEPDAVEVAVGDLEKDGFGENPLFKIFVAEVEKKIVGMALFYSRYSTWKGPTIHLEDLIVSESKRNLKIGKSLYSEVLKYGYQQGVKRIEWVVLDWNKPAIDFYKKSGALVLQDWNIVQMDEQAIKKYLTNLEE